MTESLRIGVVGSDTQAITWALTLREHGRHRVLGLRLDPAQLSDPEAIQAWGKAPIANAPTRKLADLCELIYLFPDDPSTAGVASILVSQTYLTRSGFPWLPLVIGRWDLELFRQMMQRKNTGFCPVVYNPVGRWLPTMDAMASPDPIWIASEDPAAATLVHRAWNPIINTVPVIRTGFGRVSETGLLLPPSALDALAGTLTPPSPPTFTERPEDAPDR